MRAGNFTSSEIYRLMGSPKVRETYIREKRYERALGRSLKSDTFSYPTSWGNLVESYVHEKLPFEYKLASKEVLKHPEIEGWVGTPDLVTEIVVADIKCPYTLLSFCQLIEACQDLQEFKNEYPEYYWQLVSNAILTGKDIIELIVFVPYLSELQDIRNMADAYDGEVDPFQFKWIWDAPDRKLPYLLDGGTYFDLNQFRFTISESEKEALTNRVKESLLAL